MNRVIDRLAAHGVGDTSLRSLAAAIGTSHRMLLYHFGSRDGLLTAVVDRVEAAGRRTLADERTTTGTTDDPLAAGLRFWRNITDQALTYGPLFFELSSHAMLDQPHARALRAGLVAPWIDALTENWLLLGVSPERARVFARVDLAIARGLLHELLLTGDRAAADEAMRTYAVQALADRVPAVNPPTGVR